MSGRREGTSETRKIPQLDAYKTAARRRCAKGDIGSDGLPVSNQLFGVCEKRRQ